MLNTFTAFARKLWKPLDALNELVAFNAVLCPPRQRQLRQGLRTRSTLSCESGASAAPSLATDCVDEEAPLRVCTYGGCGACSCGDGEVTLDALRFLTPYGGPKAVSSSCLARCDQAVAVMLPSGEIAEHVTGPAASAKLLQDLGFSVDKSLASAYASAQEADRLGAEGRNMEALTWYKRAFSLAISGFGLKDRSKYSPIIRLFYGSEANLVRDDLGSPGRGEQVVAAAARAAAESVTPAQFCWFARALIRRSRLYSKMAPVTEAPRRRVYASRRALVDAKCAMQLTQICIAELPKNQGDERVLVEAWERLAESYEATQDIGRAIYAYEQLLDLEPPSAPGLPATVATKRAAQELVLLSHRRGLEDTIRVRTGLQSGGERFRRILTAKALFDFEELRTLIEDDIDLLEDLARESRDPDTGFLRRSSANPFVGGGARVVDLVSNRSLNDLYILRKLARRDIDRVQLTLLRGDPLITFIRDTVGRLRWRTKGRRQRKSKSIQDVQDESDEVRWLCEQFEGGVLPEDTLLVASLLEEAKSNPERVVRLLSEAKDTRSQEEVEQLRFEVIEGVIYLAQIPLVMYLLSLTP